MPKFSIAIPAYKTSFLSKAISSVLNQTCKDFELIVLNDCSPEPVEDIVASFSDSRLIYMRNEFNVGMIDVVDNWNKCLSMATGDFFLCMGDDDELENTCLAEYDLLINSYPSLNVYHGQTLVIDENGNAVFSPLTRPEFESVYELAYYRLFGRKQYVGDFLYRTSFLKKQGGYYKLPAAWGSDDITAIIAAKGNGIANTHRTVFKYRSNPYSISSSNNVEIKLEACGLEEKWYQSFLSDDNLCKEEDVVTRYLLKKEIGKSFQKKRLRLIADDLMINPFHLFRWLRMSTEYNLTKSMIVYSAIVSVRDKKSLKFQTRRLKK